MILLSRRPSLALLLCLSALTLTSTLHSQAPAPAQPDRVLPASKSASTTRLTGHIPAWASAANDLGPVADSLPIRLSFVLTRSSERQAAFTRLLEDQQNPASPSFHKWLSPEQVGSLYGPTLHDVSALTAWLTSQGFTITEVAPSRMFVTAEATSSSIAKALGTSFHTFRFNGESRLSATAEPSIPSQFAPIVGSISGLAQIDIHPMHQSASLPMSARTGDSSASPQYTNTGSGRHFITPGDFATMFDLKPVYNSGITGTGQKVAIIGRSRVAATDISEFESATGLTANLPNVVIPINGVDPGITNNADQGEATLDVDRVIATAPAAQADLVVSSSAGGYNGIYVAAQYEVQTLLDPVMNISFGSCEVYAGPANVSLWDTLFAQAASEGISVFVSSADSGAASCDAQFSTPGAYQFLAINYICASSYATCVGATEPADFANPSQYWSSTNGTNLASALSYIPEGAWNEPTVTLSTGATAYVAASTGGGASIYVPKPSWQTGTGVPADGARDVPDASFPGAAHDGYFACYAIGGGDCANNRFEYFSGTSAAAPTLAAVTALLNQKTGSSQGNLNPLLYRTATSTPTAFHDANPASSGVTGCDVNVPSMCNNSTPSTRDLTGGLAGYALTTGYDQATGLGSLDISNFLTAATADSIKLAATQLAISESASTIANTQTNTFTATLTSSTSGTPSGTVQFYSDSTPIGTPVSLSAGVATTSALPFTAAGSFLISAIYSGDATFATTTAPGIPLTVTGAASVTTTSSSPTPIVVDSAVSFTASVGSGTSLATVPTGIVRFYLNTSNGSGYLATAPLSAGTATTPYFAFPPDTYSITSYYLGDAVYSPSHSTALTFTPQKLETQVQLSNYTASVGVNGSADFVANVLDVFGSIAPAATGTLQLYSAGTPLGSPFSVTPSSPGQPITSAIAFSQAGTFNITATYSGDAYRQPSTSTPYVLTVLPTPASYQLSSDTASLSLAAGATTGNVAGITVTPMLGFTGTVNLSCSVTYQGTGTPTAPPSCNFDQTSIPVVADAYVPITVLRVVTTAPKATTSTASSTTSLFSLLLAPLLLILAPASLRRRWRGALLTALVIPFFICLSGCGGGSSTSTPPPVTPQPGTTPGSYTVTVTATSTATGAPAATPITIALTVK